jgi:hypothetical protein
MPRSPAVHLSRPRIARSLACAALALALGGCESLLTLDGDPELCARKPSSASVADELVIVRAVENPGSHERLVLDRVRFLGPTGDEGSLDRVVFATTEKVRPAGQGLADVRRGDILRVTTTYASFVRGGGYEAFIDNWAANEGECWEGGWVSLHTLERVERTASAP